MLENYRRTMQRANARCSFDRLTLFRSHQCSHNPFSVLGQRRRPMPCFLSHRQEASAAKVGYRVAADGLPTRRTVPEAFALLKATAFQTLNEGRSISCR